MQALSDEDRRARRGRPHAPLMFIGEGRGSRRTSGRPFVGGGHCWIRCSRPRFEAGQVYICNIVKCRPPQGRVPEPDERAAAKDYPAGVVRPKVIVPPDPTPTRALLGETCALRATAASGSSKKACGLCRRIIRRRCATRIKAPRVVDFQAIRDKLIELNAYPKRRRADGRTKSGRRPGPDCGVCLDRRMRWSLARAEIETDAHRRAPGEQESLRGSRLSQGREESGSFSGWPGWRVGNLYQTSSKSARRRQARRTAEQPAADAEEIAFFRPWLMAEVRVNRVIATLGNVPLQAVTDSRLPSGGARKTDGGGRNGQAAFRCITRQSDLQPRAPV
ncbi:MAG: hypothetical protein ACLUI3_10485 [Christensenellales bacterium]